MPGAPQPPASACPFCNAPPTPNVTGHYFTDGAGPVKAATPQQETSWEAEKARRRANGWIEPGSELERQVLQQMDDDRVEVLAEKRARKAGRPGMRAVYGNHFTGKSLYRQKNKRRKRLGQMPLFDGSGRIFVDAREG